MVLVESDVHDIVPGGGVVARKHWSTRALSFPATFCEIIEKCSMKWLGGAWWHCTHVMDSAMMLVTGDSP